MGHKKESMNLKGFDCSEFQGVIDWNTVSKSIDFAIIRAGFGTSRADYQFIRNRDEVRRVNLPHGFYWYSYPNQNSPESEAEFFLKTIGEVREGEILFLDFEEQYNGDVVGYCKKFLDTLSLNLSGYKPLIYLNLSQTKAFNWKPIINNDNGLWLADYGVDPTNPTFDTPWPTVAFLQFTDNGVIPGIPAKVDLDVFYGSQDALKAYGYKAVDPCSNIKAELKNHQDQENANWNIVDAIGQQLKINPDPNDKPSTATKFVVAIRQLQDDNLTLTKTLQDTINQFDDYKKTHPDSIILPPQENSAPQSTPTTGNSSFKNGVVSVLKFLKIGG